MSLKCGCQQLPQNTNVASIPDGNVKGVEMGMNDGDTKECACKLRQVKCNARRPSPRRSMPSHPTQGCCCVPSNKPVEITGICKCGKSPIKELEYEKERRLRMEEEVRKLKLQIAEVMQSKCMALSMTKHLKQKYEKMKSAHEDTESQLASISREREYLCRCLEKQKLQNKPDKGESAVQVKNKDIDKTALKTISEQNAKIRSLNDSLQNMSITVEETDFEKKKLEHEKHKIHEKLQKNKDMTKRLSETNARLAKSVRQKHDSFMAIRNRAGKYQKELTEYKDEVRRSQLELEKLKTEIKRQKSKGDSASSPKSSEKQKSIDNLQGKLKKTKERERRASETIQLLGQKIRDLEVKDPKALERDLQQANKNLKTLQVKYDEALSKLKSFEEADQKRAEVIKTEMKSFTDDVIAKETAYLQEKETMKALIEELKAIIDQQRKRIDEMQELKTQQDVVIKSQNEQLISKEEEIRLREKENDLVKEQCLDLDKQLDSLRTSVADYDRVGSKVNQVEYTEKLASMSNEIEGLKAALKDEQEKSRIKDTVIGDQYTSIQALKKQQVDSEDKIRRETSKSMQLKARAADSEVKLDRVSRELAKEQEVRRTTASDLKTMKRKQRKLEQDVETLEEAYEEMSSMSVAKLEEGQKYYQEGQKQYQEEQKQWDNERQKLVEERDRAIEAAKLATTTLMETMDDFQGQIKSQQKLQKIVADIISSKSDQRIPPCVKHAEINRLKMQLAVPCRPLMPPCRPRIPPCMLGISNDEDGFFTASSGRSDTTDSHPSRGLLKMFGSYSNCLSTVPPLPDSQTDECRCINHLCQCSQKQSATFKLPIAGRSNIKPCYPQKPKHR